MKLSLRHAAPLLSLCACIALFFMACEESTADYDLDYGYEYAPMEVGKYWIYQVDSTVYEIDGNGSEVRYDSRTYVREEVVDLDIDSEGDSLFIIERYEKDSLAEVVPWEYERTLAIKRAERSLERIEDNIRLIELVFPLRAGADFDAALHVDPEVDVAVAGGETVEPFLNWDSEVLSVGESDTVGGFIFPEVAHIEYADDLNALNLRFVNGAYARNVGMVYREEWILDNQDTQGDWEDPLWWTENAEKGFILRQTLLSFN